MIRILSGPSGGVQQLLHDCDGQSLETVAVRNGKAQVVVIRIRPFNCISSLCTASCLIDQPMG